MFSGIQKHKNKYTDYGLTLNRVIKYMTAKGLEPTIN